MLYVTYWVCGVSGIFTLGVVAERFRNPELENGVACQRAQQINEDSVWNALQSLMMEHTSFNMHTGTPEEMFTHFNGY